MSSYSVTAQSNVVSHDELSAEAPGHVFEVAGSSDALSHDVTG